MLLPLGGSVRIGEADREIVRRAGTEDRLILRLDGVDDRPGVEALRGADLMVARTAAPPLEPGEYWAEDLEGCRVVTAEGRELGVVEGLRALPSCEVLEVGELLVPMVGDAVRVVDIAARRIVVDARLPRRGRARRAGGGRRASAGLSPLRLDVVTLFPAWFRVVSRRSATCPTRWRPGMSCARSTCASTRR